MLAPAKTPPGTQVSSLLIFPWLHGSLLPIMHLWVLALHLGTGQTGPRVVSLLFVAGSEGTYQNRDDALWQMSRWIGKHLSAKKQALNWKIKGQGGPSQSLEGTLPSEGGPLLFLVQIQTPPPYAPHVSSPHVGTHVASSSWSAVWVQLRPCQA